MAITGEILLPRLSGSTLRLPLTASLLGFRGDALSLVRTGWLFSGGFELTGRQPGGLALTVID
jgi:hypothetical protein